MKLKDYFVLLRSSAEMSPVDYAEWSINIDVCKFYSIGMSFRHYLFFHPTFVWKFAFVNTDGSISYVKKNMCEKKTLILLQVQKSSVEKK